MNFSITGPSETVPILIAPSKEPKDEKKEYLAQILILEEKLKQYRHFANELPASAQAATIKKLQKKVHKANQKFEDYKKSAENEKIALREHFELELFKQKEETEQIRHENEVLKKKIAQVQRLFNSSVQV